MCSVAVSSRNAGIVQGILLISCSWLSVVASGALIGPVIPKIIQAFSPVDNVEWLVAQVAAVPALFVALCSWPMGALADRVGPRKVLMIATLLYAIAGLAPYLLQNLWPMIVSRAVVGAAEGAVMTCSYALIGAYFSGKTRERYYASTTGTAPVMALVAIALGGGLGESNWRNIFLVYFFALVMFVGCLLLLWEPDRTAAARPATPGIAASADGASFRWSRLIGICAISIFVMSAFMITILQTGLLMTERGIDSPAVIGRWQAIASLANPAGAAAFMFLGWRYHTKLALSFAFMAAGLAAIALNSDWQSVIWGGAIANFGCGMILPTVVSWGLEDLPATVRGKAAGLLMTCNFLGQYVSPTIVLGLKGMTGSLSHAVLVYAMACAAGLVLTALAMRSFRSVATSV
jgi:MFS family permease